MNFSEINPYIRFAVERGLSEDYSHPIAAYDFRLFYGLSGRLLVEVDGKLLPVTKNTLVIVPPAHFYRLLADKSEKEPSLFGLLNFDMTCTHDDQKLSIMPQPLGRFDPSLVISDDAPTELSAPISLETDLLMTEHLHQITSRFLHKPPLYREECSAHLKYILTLAMRNAIQRQHDRPRIVEDVLDFIRANYQSPITGELITEKFAYHPNYIGRVFKASMGQSLHRYVIHYRLRVAGTLLTSTNDSIDEIARAVGFESPSYFSKYFKEYFGESPLKFRTGNTNRPQ
jgi:AraC-like DNA-binding protein